MYDSYLKDIIKKIGHNRTTDTDALTKVGGQLLGKLFRGVFPSDRIPRMRTGQYCILNLDRSSEGGSHWIAVAKDAARSFVVYDSFGRKATKIIPSLAKLGKTRDTEDDAEQGLLEENCGQRSLAWLMVYHNHGKSSALLI